MGALRLGAFPVRLSGFIPQEHYREQMLNTGGFVMMLLRKGAILLALTALLTGCAAGPLDRSRPVQVALAPAAPPAHPQPDPVAQVPGRLLFLSDRQATIVEAGERRSVELPPGLTAAALSPDGVQLAGLLDGAITLLSLFDGRTVSLARTEGLALSWAPTGDRLLAHAGREGETLLELHGVSGGGEPQRITIPAGGPVTVKWAPDSTRLAVQIGPAYQPDNNLWLVDLSQSTVRLLAKGAHRPTWSPDGSRLAYARSVTRTTDEVIIWQEGGEPQTVIREEQLVTAFPAHEELFAKNDPYIYNLRWSPRGERLVAVSKVAGPDPRFALISAHSGGCVDDLWVLPLHLDRQEQRQGVIQWPPRPCSPGPFVWVKGGQQIAVLLYGPGCAGTLAILDAGSLALVRRFQAVEEGLLLASPDGGWVAVTTERSTTLFDLAMPDEPVQFDGLGHLLHWAQP